MDTKTALYIGLFGLVSALIGALSAITSQFVSGYYNLRSKEIEQVYARKADTYKNLMEKAGAFANDMNNEEKYLEFIHAYYATLLVSSNSVLQAFKAKENIASISLQLRAGHTDLDAQENLKESWKTIMNKLTDEMRKDLLGYEKL
jgi:hypothetical protein